MNYETRLLNDIKIVLSSESLFQSIKKLPKKSAGYFYDGATCGLQWLFVEFQYTNEKELDEAIWGLQAKCFGIKHSRPFEQREQFTNYQTRLLRGIVEVFTAPHHLTHFKILSKKMAIVQAEGMITAFELLISNFDSEVKEEFFLEKESFLEKIESCYSR